VSWGEGGWEGAGGGTAGAGAEGFYFGDLQDQDERKQDAFGSGFVQDYFGGDAGDLYAGVECFA
jgi:hypothetical protein